MKREVYSPEESSLPAASNNGGHESNVVSFLEQQKSQLEKKTKDALRNGFLG